MYPYIQPLLLLLSLHILQLITKKILTSLVSQSSLAFPFPFPFSLLLPFFFFFSDFFPKNRDLQLVVRSN